MYQGLSRPNLRLRFASTAGGTALSLLRNGLPLISRIIQNVKKMTNKMIGIVQKTRRTTNFSMRFYFLVCGAVIPSGRRTRRPLGQASSTDAHLRHVDDVH